MISEGTGNEKIVVRNLKGSTHARMDDGCAKIFCILTLLHAYDLGKT